jgi:hypothetical protein
MAGGAETPNIAALPAIARLGTCESARGPDAYRHVKLLSQFAVEGSLSGAYSQSAVSVALTRQMLWRFAGAPEPFGLLAIDGAISRERGSHADVREGAASFLEKRPPTFLGKVTSDMPSQYPWWTESWSANYARPIRRANGHFCAKPSFARYWRRISAKADSALMRYHSGSSPVLALQRVHQAPTAPTFQPCLARS